MTRIQELLQSQYAGLRHEPMLTDCGVLAVSRGVEPENRYRMTAFEHLIFHVNIDVDDPWVK
jgi:hypothetical protein